MGLSNFWLGLSEGLQNIDSPFQEQYQGRPLAFIREVLGAQLWSKQVELTELVRDNRRVSVMAAPATGKTFGAACIALYLLNCYPHCKVILTAAPPERQIKDLLMAEVRGLQTSCLGRGVPLVGGIPRTMGIFVDNDWWLQGFTIPTSGTADQRIAKFHGHHGRGGTFAIVDEAHGVPPEILEAIDNCLAGFSRLLLLYNPLAPVGIAFQSTQDRTYRVLQISAFDHPNVIEGEVIYPGMVDREVTQNRIDQYTRPATSIDYESERLIITVPWTGEDRVVTNAVFCYKVLGEFPWEAETALVKLAHIHRARLNYDRLMDQLHKQDLIWPVGLPDPICGLDMAEYGGDFVTLATRYGHILAPLTRWNEADTPTTVDRVARMCREIRPAKVLVDAIGFTLVAPNLCKEDIDEEGNKINAIGVSVSWAPVGPYKEGHFRNVRSQLGFAVRDWFRRTDVCIPDDEMLIADLLALEYRKTLRGFVITNKDKLRDRLRRSPDSYDALAMTFYPGGPRGRDVEAGMETMMLRGRSRRAGAVPGPRNPFRPRGRRL